MQVQLGRLLAALGLFVMLAGCFDGATVCSVQQDCFVGERCVAGTCQAGASSTSNGEPCTPDRPERCGTTCVAAGRCVPDDCRLQGCEGLTFCDESDGVCKPGCSSDDDCPGSQSCDLSSRLCSCDAGQQLCSGACRLCPQDASILSTGCSGQACVAQSCAEGFLLCGTSCSACPPDAQAVGCDAQNNCVAANCEPGQLECRGSCTACPSGDGIDATGCQEDRCVISVCADGFELCDEACAPCPTGDAVLSTGCAGGRCQATSCAEGFAVCDDASDKGCCPVMVQRLPPNGPIESVTPSEGAASSHDLGLVVDVDDQPHVVYHRPVNRDMRYATWNGQSWSIQTIDSGTGAGFNLSLAIDDQQTLHLAYLNQGDQRLYYRTKLKGADWSQASPIDSTMGSGAGIELALDQARRPHVVYYSQSNRSVRYGLLSRGSWSTTGITANVTMYFRPSIAFDNNQPRALVSVFDSNLQGPVLYQARPVGFGGNWTPLFLRRGAYRANLHISLPDNAPSRGTYFQQQTDNSFPPNVESEVLRYSFIAAQGLTDEQDIDSFDVKSVDTYFVSLISDVPSQQLTPNVIYAGPVDATTSVVRFANRVGNVWMSRELARVADTRPYVALDHDDDGLAHSAYSADYTLSYWRSP